MAPGVAYCMPTRSGGRPPLAPVTKARGHEPCRGTTVGSPVDLGCVAPHEYAIAGLGVVAHVTGGAEREPEVASVRCSNAWAR